MKSRPLGLFLDPLQFPGDCLNPTESYLVRRYVAAYLVRVGTMPARVTPV